MLIRKKKKVRSAQAKCRSSRIQIVLFGWTSVAEIMELADQLARWTICTEFQKIRNLAKTIKRGKLRDKGALKALESCAHAQMMAREGRDGVARCHGIKQFPTLSVSGWATKPNWGFHPQRRPRLSSSYRVNQSIGISPLKNFNR
jgi:hypothetical protein